MCSATRRSGQAGECGRGGSVGRLTIEGGGAGDDVETDQDCRVTSNPKDG